jgi:site-specific recombinase XerD
MASTREDATKRFVYVAKNWLRFLGKWRDPIRNAQFRQELDAFLEQLKACGHSEQTVSTRASALNPFSEWLGGQGISLKNVVPETLAAYFVQNQTRRWKKSTIKAYVQSLREFFRYASERGWCAPALAETIQRPKIYSLSGLPQGPSWEQVQSLIAKLDTERPGHIRDRAIILLLAVYGLRIGEVCALRLDNIDWTNDRIHVRRSKNRRIQEFPLTAEIGNAILKYLQKVRPKCSSRFLFLSLRTPHCEMMGHGISCSIGLRIRSLGFHLPHYGPHSLRHACATHLLDEGFTLKEIGDHLGHRSQRSTQIYAKVERKKLQQVAGPVLSTLTDYLRSQALPVSAGWTKERLHSLREVSAIGLGGLQ